MTSLPVKVRLAACLLVIAGCLHVAGVSLSSTLALLSAGFGLIILFEAKPAGNVSSPASSTKTEAEFAADPAHDVMSIVEALDLPTVILDRQLSVRAHNTRARELFPQLQVGEPLSPAVRNPDLFRAAEEAFASASARSVELHNRIPIDRKFLVRLNPLRLEYARLTGEENDGQLHLLLQLWDQTEQARLTQMRSDFIANASHELRTPLASLRGFIETLRGAARHDIEAHEKFLGIMDEQALRMTLILDDLLSLSRIEMRTHLLPGAIVDLGNTVATVVRGLEPLATDARIAINIKDNAEAAYVRGDRHELEQVFRNLIQNAIKYGSEGGKVEISIVRVQASGSRRERIAVSVIDDGPGIAAEHLPRLTERFYRVDTAASRQRGGTGLGLAIVKHIVMRHRGELNISSKVGEGSTFTVTLDAAAGLKQAAGTPRPANID